MDREQQLVDFFIKLEDKIIEYKTRSEALKKAKPEEVGNIINLPALRISSTLVYQELLKVKVMAIKVFEIGE